MAILSRISNDRKFSLILSFMDEEQKQPNEVFGDFKSSDEAYKYWQENLLSSGVMFAYISIATVTNINVYTKNEYK